MKAYLEASDRLTAGRKSYYDYKGNESTFEKNFALGKLLTYKINFQNKDYPMITLYKSDTILKTIREFTEMKKNKVFFQPPTLASLSKQEEISSQTQRISSNSLRGTYSQPALLNNHKPLNPPSFQESHYSQTQRPLYSVCHYSKTPSDGGFIRPIEFRIAKDNEQGKRDRTVLSHLSRNRNLAEFRPFFEPKGVKAKEFFIGIRTITLDSLNKEKV